MKFAIFGGLQCLGNDHSACAACTVKASAFLINFLLNENAYSDETSREWEKNIFIRSIKTFNHMFGYQDSLDQYPDITYNQTLHTKLQEVYDKYKNTDTPMVPIKLDYMAQRSIPDNLVLETSQNLTVIILSYTMMFIYVSVAIGFFPSAVHNRFLLGFTGIVVVIFSLLISVGITQYAAIPMTMISAEVVPFLILAIGVDNMFLISRAEREVAPQV